MAESEAQRKARERNLRKGNPAAYGGAAQGDAEDPPRESDPPAQGGAQGAPRTFRGRAKGGSQGAPRAPRTPKPRKTPPRAPGPAQGGAQGAPREAPRAAQGGGGFLSGLLEGFGG